MIDWSKSSIEAYVNFIVNKYPDIRIFMVDLFCGAGGTTTGAEEAEENGKKVCKVVACVNHDTEAIESHELNHSDCLHAIEKIQKFNIKPLIYLIELLREKVPDCIIVLWASPDCTNFSKAKGGLPRNADSRVLAVYLYRYIRGFKPDYIYVENVEEFMSWGPLDENGKPLSKYEGQDYIRWVNKIKRYGYDFDHRFLNSADYGCYTSRTRYFGQFVKNGLPMKWPRPTHSRNPEKTMFSNLEKWKAVKEVLDFSDEGESIFDRKKPITSEKTFERIYAGLIKYVAGGKQAFIKKWNSNNEKTGINSGVDIDSPCPTVTTQNRLGIVQPKFLLQRNSGDPSSKVCSIENPSRTLTSTAGNLNLVQPCFLSKTFSGRPEGKNIPIDGPCSTLTTFGGPKLVTPKFLIQYNGKSESHNVTEPCNTLSTKDRFALVKPCFWVDKSYSGKDNHQNVDQPAGSILANDKHALVKAEYFLDRNFSKGGQNQDVNRPAGSLLTVPKMNLVKCEKWLMNHTFKVVGSSVNNPCPTLLASRKHFYLMNPQYNSAGRSIEDPAFTLIAWMEKAPPYLITTEKGELAIEIYETDSPAVRKIKEFMAMYGIIDIKMRMLKIPELLRIQGFPSGYILKGNQGKQKKFIGNSVVPMIARVLIEANYRGLVETLRLAA